MQLFWKQDPSESSTQYGWTFEDKDARAKFLKDHAADIFWYTFPEEELAWIKGPAWKISAAEAAVARQEEPSDVDGDDRW
jgi:hypothetical protein